MQNSSGAACELAVSNEEKELGVKITEDLKHRAQSKMAASKANRVLGTLEKTFKCRSLELWKTLYVTYVRPHIEFATQTWSPYHQEDIEILERFQLRDSKVISGFSKLSYEESLPRVFHQQSLSTME